MAVQRKTILTHTNVKRDLCGLVIYFPPYTETQKSVQSYFHLIK